MTQNNRRIGPMLRLTLAAGAALSPLAGPLLKRRLARGKEDPDRWREKLGHATAPRPEGPLVWLHGVGVGEVMALRGLIAALGAARPDLSFLLTSSARSSAQVIDANLPDRTRHQYLPLDLPLAVTRFLDHWRPDLAVWSDQEVWPRLAVTCARRGIPQAYVAARITEASARARAKFGGAYGDLYGLIDRIHVQDKGTADRLAAMMGEDAHLEVSGSLKAAAAPLADHPHLRAQVPQGRFTWVAAPTHPADVDIALTAQRALCQNDTPLLIIAPRALDQADQIAARCDRFGLSHGRRSAQTPPDPAADVFIADSFGELGAWYRTAQAALIGGTFDATEGHNPWEAAALGCAILHGPRVANFKTDFAQLHAEDAAVQIATAEDLIAALSAPDLPHRAHQAATVRDRAATGLDRITGDLLSLLKV